MNIEWPIYVFCLKGKNKLLLAERPGVVLFYARFKNVPHSIFLPTLQSRRATWFWTVYLPTQHFWHHLVSGIFADTANFLNGNGNGNEYIIHVGKVSIWKYSTVTVQWRKDELFKNWSWHNRSSIKNKNKLDIFLNSP